MILWAWSGGGTVGARVKDQSRVKELETIINQEILVGIPDFFGFGTQGNLFGGFGGGRDIAIHLQSANVDALYAAAAEGRRLMGEAFPQTRVQVWPGIEDASPELQIMPRDQRMNEVGLDRRSDFCVGRRVRNRLCSFGLKTDRDCVESVCIRHPDGSPGDVRRLRLPRTGTSCDAD